MPIGIIIIIGIPPHIIMTGAPAFIIEFIASQRSFMRAIIDGSVGIIFMTMPSFVISHVMRQFIGIMPMPIICGIIIGAGIIGIIGIMPICGIIPPIIIPGIMPICGIIPGIIICGIIIGDIDGIMPFMGMPIIWGICGIDIAGIAPFIGMLFIIGIAFMVISTAEAECFRELAREGTEPFTGEPRTTRLKQTDSSAKADDTHRAADDVLAALRTTRQFN